MLFAYFFVNLRVILRALKLLKIAILSFLGVLILAACWIAVTFAESFAAAQSVESPRDGLYTFTYRGDNGFDDFLQRGGAH